jgi:hypothetical protein
MMTTNLERRKLSIIEYLAEVDDESIVQQIEHILKPTSDFWDELGIAEKQTIERGIEQLDRDERISYSEYRDKLEG